jgi:hypothetical protein
MTLVVLRSRAFTAMERFHNETTRSPERIFSFGALFNGKNFEPKNHTRSMGYTTADSTSRAKSSDLRRLIVSSIWRSARVMKRELEELRVLAAEAIVTRFTQALRPSATRFSQPNRLSSADRHQASHDNCARMVPYSKIEPTATASGAKNSGIDWPSL